MKLAFHGATTMTSDLETDVSVSALADFKALEIWAEKLDRYLTTRSLGNLRALFAENGIAPLALNSIEFIAFRGSEFGDVQARLHALGRIAKVIGCPTIVVVPSPLPSRTISWTEVVAEYVKVLRELSAIAETYGVRLSFEFLGFGWCSVRTPRAACEIVRAVDRNNVGLTIDAAHFHVGGASLSELDWLDPKRIFAFHLDDLEDGPREAMTDAMRVLPGSGILPLQDICARLQGIGYDGPCAVELFRPEYWNWPPLDLARRAHQAAVRVLTPYFQLE